MYDPSQRQRDERLMAIVVTVCFHALCGGALFAAGEFVERGGGAAAPIEVEIVQPRPKKIEKKVETKKIEEEEKVEEEKVEEVKVEEKVEKKVEKKRVRKRTRVARKTTAAPVTSEQPAAGPNTNNDAPAPVISLPDLGIGGTGPPAARGRPKTRRVGTGGNGTNTGGGGARKSTGTGGPPPVSIAAIKKRAKPLNADLDTGKLYTAEAKRLGIEGQVKVFLVVDATGKVVDRKLTKRLGHGLDQVAMKLAKKLRFRPAEDTNGRPVADKLEWTFTFVVPK